MSERFGVAIDTAFSLVLERLADVGGARSRREFLRGDLVGVLLVGALGESRGTRFHMFHAEVRVGVAVAAAVQPQPRCGCGRCAHERGSRFGPADGDGSGRGERRLKELAA